MARKQILVVAFVAAASACGTGLAGSQRAREDLQPFKKLSGSVFEIRPVRYQGGTNGTMIVEVRNSGTERRQFTAEGLYFVPDRDPDDAPQRVGAAGPFVRDAGGNDARFVDAIYINPGDIVRLGLGVFCIDHDRMSPNSGTPFVVADERMPAALGRAIHSGAQRIILDNHGDVAGSRDAVQEHVWEMRKAGLLRLQGD